MGFKCVWAGLALSSFLAAQAQTAATTTIQSSAANASFDYLSDDGCVRNEVILFAHRTTVVSGRTPGATVQATYSRHRYDHCEDVDLGPDVGTQPAPGFFGGLEPRLAQRHHQWTYVVGLSMDDQDISGTTAGASLQMTLKTISR